jgi:hypothetical protein
LLSLRVNSWALLSEVLELVPLHSDFDQLNLLGSK